MGSRLWFDEVRVRVSEVYESELRSGGMKRFH